MCARARGYLFFVSVCVRALALDWHPRGFGGCGLVGEGFVFWWLVGL